jgi:hypothetical protein
MNKEGDAAAAERLLRPMTRNLTADLACALVNLTADEETQARYDLLAGKNTEGALDSAEREELDSLVRINTLLGVLKAEAHAVLTKAA